jgi:hypothetical protein
MSEESREKAGAWLDAYCKAMGIDWEKLSLTSRFLLTRQVPCSICCWRVGGPVDVEPGKPCPECGSLEAPKQVEALEKQIEILKADYERLVRCVHAVGFPSGRPWTKEEADLAREVGIMGDE